MLGCQKNLNAVMSFLSRKLPALGVVGVKVKMVLVWLSLAPRWGLVNL